MNFQPASFSARPRSRSPRDQVLREWRGVDLNPLEKARKDNIRPIGALVGDVTKELRLERRQAETEIVKVWNHSMDANIAAHAQPTGLNKGTLFVTVDSNVWLDEIVRYRRREILQRLQHSFGSEVIKRISFRVG